MAWYGLGGAVTLAGLALLYVLRDGEPIPLPVAAPSFGVLLLLLIVLASRRRTPN